MLPLLALGGVGFLFLMSMGKQQNKPPPETPKPKEAVPGGGGNAVASTIGTTVGTVSTALGGIKAGISALGGTAGTVASSSSAGTVASNAATTAIQIGEGVGAGIVLGIVAIAAIAATVLSKITGASRVLDHKLTEVTGNPMRTMILWEQVVLERYMAQEGISADCTVQPFDPIMLTSWYSADDRTFIQDNGYRQPVYTWGRGGVVKVGTFGKALPAQQTAAEFQVKAASLRSAAWAYTVAAGYISNGLYHVLKSGNYNGGFNVLEDIRNQEAYVVNKPPYGDNFVDKSGGNANTWKVVDVPEPNWWKANDAFQYPSCIWGFELPRTRYVETVLCRQARLMALQHCFGLLHFDTKVYLPWSERDYTERILHTLENVPDLAGYVYLANDRSIGIKVNSPFNPTTADIVIDVVSAKEAS